MEDEMMELMVGVLCICLCAIIVIVIVLCRPKSGNNSQMKALLLESEKRQQESLYKLQQQVSDGLMYFQTNVSEALKQDLHALNETTTQRLFSIEKNVNQNLTNGYETTSKVFGKVLQQMGKLDESQENLKELSLSIHHLQSVLTDKKTRGIFGEIELYALLETAMGQDYKRYAKQYKLGNGSIADAVVFASAPLHMICIDSKFPLENFNRMMEQSATQEERKKASLVFAQDVKRHIKTIADKYIISHETAEFAYMFIPAEAIFSYLHSSAMDIIQYSYEQKVYIVSPTTLMAYITAIKAIYIGQQRNEHVIEIQRELKNLQVEFERFEKRYTAINSDFEKTYQDMKLLQITAHKLMLRFKEIQAVDLKDNTSVE